MRSLRSIAVVAIIAFAQAQAQEPAAKTDATATLHHRIDEVIERANPIVSELTIDGEFVRRLYLDLTGRIPSREEYARFVADASPQKREQLIDSLLASPEHARQMARWFDISTMERRSDKYVPAAEWQAYLFESFLANKPYNVLVREILTADGVDPAVRGRAKFLLDREAEPSLLTRDVGRMFFGRDLQCAQCHDHPLVDDYYQGDYYGLMAYFNRLSIFTLPDKRVVLAEKAEGEVTYQSVFDRTAKGVTRPRAPGGTQLVEPEFNGADAYEVAPAKDVRHVPKHSRVKKLAEEATSGANAAFNRNIANRLWAHMFGRGIVDPVDWEHSGNPPSNGELLDVLATDLVAHGFDIRYLIREIALTSAYQRRIDLPTSKETLTKIQLALGNRSDSAEFATAFAQAKSAVNAAHGALTDARKKLADTTEALNKAHVDRAEVEKGIAAATQVVATANQQIEVKTAAKFALELALQAAENAKAKLPDEASLATISQTASQRIPGLKQEIDNLRSGLVAQLAAETEAKAKLPPQLAVIEERKKAVGESDQQVRERENALTSASEALRIAAAKSSASEQQAKWATLFTTTGETLRQKLSLDTDANALRMARETALAKATELSGAIASAETALAKQNEALTLVAQEVMQHEEAARVTASKIQTLQEAIAAVNKAKEALAQDSELTESAKQFETRLAESIAKLSVSNNQLADATTRKQDLERQVGAGVESIGSLRRELEGTQAVVESVSKQLAECVATCESLAPKVADAADEWLASNVRAFRTAKLRHLTPEQLGWSILEATGVLQNYRIATITEVENSEAFKTAAPDIAPRKKSELLEKGLFDKLNPSVQPFINLYGAGAGQPQSDFFASADQALFLTNGGSLKLWLVPSGENLTGRLLKIEDPSAMANELYATVLSRAPTSDETRLVAEFMARRGANKAAAVQELAWALMTSVEFRFVP